MEHPESPLEAAGRRANAAFAAEEPLREAMHKFGFINVVKTECGYVAIDDDGFAAVVAWEDGSLVCRTHADAMADRCTAICLLYASVKEGLF